MVEPSIAPAIIAAEHPSLDDQIEQFLDALGDEPRYFGPRGRSNPKPFPSLRSELRKRGGFRLAAMIDGEVVGLVRVGGGGHVHLAVRAEWRRHGLGTALLGAAVERASAFHYGRLTLTSTRRSAAVRRLGDRLGCTTVDVGRGQVELILPVGAPADIASA